MAIEWLIGDPSQLVKGLLLGTLSYAALSVTPEPTAGESTALEEVDVPDSG